MLQAFRLLLERISESELVRLVDQGADAVRRAALTEVALERAFLPLRDALRRTTARGFAIELPRIPRQGRNRTLGVQFDVLSPRVIDAVRGLETRVMRTLGDQVRETVRAHIENGLRDGVNPRQVARSLRTVIGLAPNQERAIANFEAKLRGGTRATVFSDILPHRNAEGKLVGGLELRDKRFDATIKRAIRDGEKLSDAKVAQMTEAYRKRMVAFNAETNARTATLDSLKLGQRLAWDEARAQGFVAGEMTKTWVGVKDDRERPEHLAMEGETVPIDSLYSNGQQQPGDGEYNCRCVSVYRVAKAR